MLLGSKLYSMESERNFWIQSKWMPSQQISHRAPLCCVRATLNRIIQNTQQCPSHWQNSLQLSLALSAMNWTKKKKRKNVQTYTFFYIVDSCKGLPCKCAFIMLHFFPVRNTTDCRKRSNQSFTFLFSKYVPAVVIFDQTKLEDKDSKEERFYLSLGTLRADINVYLTLSTPRLYTLFTSLNAKLS